MNKLFSLTFATALSAAVLAAPLMAQSIVVTPNPTYDVFVERVTDDLERQINRSAGAAGLPDVSGITIVRFQRGEDGKPHKLSVTRKSGDRKLDRFAMRSVQRLSSLGAVPIGVEDDQIYQANIIFARSTKDGDRLSARLAQEEAARIASSPAERQVFAFGSAPSRPTS